MTDLARERSRKARGQHRRAGALLGRANRRPRQRAYAMNRRGSPVRLAPTGDEVLVDEPRVTRAATLPRLVGQGGNGVLDAEHELSTGAQRGIGADHTPSQTGSAWFGALLLRAAIRTGSRSVVDERPCRPPASCAPSIRRS